MPLRNSETYPEGSQSVFLSARIPYGCDVTANAAEASIVNSERAELADRLLEAISQR